MTTAVAAKPVSKLKGKDPKKAEPKKPKILIFGKPGVGKTWTAIDFPNVFLIDSEGGANLNHYTDRLKTSGGVYMGPEDGALDFKTVIEQFQALATEKHPYKTVVVDSLSKLYNSAIANESDRLGDKDAFGASKKPAIALMRRFVNWVNRIDMNVIFINHEKEVWGADDKGQRTITGVTFDCWDKLEYELDLALNIQKQGPSRIAVVRKSRLTGFPDGDRFDWSYAKFAERYGKDVMEAAPKVITLATTEQVTEVRRLLEAVKVSEEEIGKWFTRAGVSDWPEMDEETINKVIAFLKGKI